MGRDQTGSGAVGAIRAAAITADGSTSWRRGNPVRRKRSSPSAKRQRHPSRTHLFRLNSLNPPRPIALPDLLPVPLYQLLPRLCPPSVTVTSSVARLPINK
jgi:hypothetical protein